ncbi:MAG: hypothetical protein KDD94_11670 [Calditrichaeota bacterium]|nr:hypothetical protein [Calditrichota bacterium]
MKAIVLSGILCLPLFCQANDASVVMKFRQLDWLLGKWQRINVRSGRTAFESWQKVSDKEFTGNGITLSNADTVFVEKLKITVRDNQLYYMADVKENAEPTYFRISEIGEKQFVCENPQHDFPKKISYVFDGKQLIAQISGNGKAIDFIFRKADN